MDSIRVLVSNKFFLLAHGLIRNKVAGTVYGTANHQPRPVVFGKHKALSDSDAYFLCLGGWPHNKGFAADREKRGGFGILGGKNEICRRSTVHPGGG